MRLRILWGFSAYGDGLLPLCSSLGRRLLEDPGSDVDGVPVRMARHLGFFVLEFDNHTQPIRDFEFVDPKFVEEVRQELGYDLHLTDGSALPGLRGKFRYTVPRNGSAAATQ